MDHCSRDICRKAANGEHHDKQTFNRRGKLMARIISDFSALTARSFCGGKFRQWTFNGALGKMSSAKMHLLFAIAFDAEASAFPVH